MRHLLLIDHNLIPNSLTTLALICYTSFLILKLSENIIETKITPKKSLQWS